MIRRWHLVAVCLLVLAGAAWWQALDRWINATVLPPLLADTSVEMRDRNSELLRIYTVDGGRWRLGAKVAQVAPIYLDMLTAYEDKRFYSHRGVDLVAMGRAIAQAVWNGRVVSGGSTLTMQVARLLEDSGTGRVGGKLRQMRLAWALERRLSKGEILSLYLTHAPYGGNIEGVRAATLAWFGKEPARLTPAQAALLVALPQSPEMRRPDRHADAARAARDRVLKRAADSGVISHETLEAALLEPVPVNRRTYPALAPHLTDRALSDDPLTTRHDLTLDANLQRELEKLARVTLAKQPAQVSIAMMVVDHASGEVLASVGSASYGQSSARQGFVDMTRAVRSPGSTLKPLIYAMAFDRGLAHPETVIEDQPVNYGGYAPQNFDGAYRGEVRVREALRQSLNIPAVMLLDEIGPARFMNRMRKAGMKPVLPGGKPGLAVALGGVGVTLEDLVGLYAGLARGGEAVPLLWRSGLPRAAETGRIASRAAAWQVGNILAGAQGRSYDERQLVVKTGTSYGHRDVWAIGWDGQHAAGVWIGRPDGTPVPGAFGGDIAAPVLAELFQRIKPTLAPLPPPPPEALLLTTAQLPQPLQRFHGRQKVFEKALDAPVLAFPPDGSRLSLESGARLVVKIRNGQPPFSILANGAPAVTGAQGREIELGGIEPGFVALSVIDARGQSARAQVRLD